MHCGVNSKCHYGIDCQAEFEARRACGKTEDFKFPFSGTWESNAHGQARL